MSTAFVAKVRQFALQFRYVLISLVLLNISPLCDLAQDGHSHTPTPQQHEPTPQQKVRRAPLSGLSGNPPSASGMYTQLRQRAMSFNSAA
jgi:hypothetical protein